MYNDYIEWTPCPNCDTRESFQYAGGQWQPEEVTPCCECEERMRQEEKLSQELKVLQSAYFILEDYEEKSELHPLFEDILKAGSGIERILSHFEYDS